MNRTHLLFVAAAAVLGTAGFAAGTAQAQMAPAGVPAQTERMDAAHIVDAAEMADVLDLVQRMEPYLYVAEDGTMQLRDDATAEALGVSQAYLDDYRAAMADSNTLIERGEVTLSPDFEVTMAALPDGAVNPVIGLPGPGGAVTEGDGAASDASLGGASMLSGASPDNWSAYGYNTGAMFYNSYNVYRQYYNNYYNLCNTMAAYIRQPWISSNLAYFYGYNGNQLNNSCYQSQGMWYYLPYQQGCQQWVPTLRSYTNQCYGSTVGYRPGYLWQSRYAYNNNCRCYQSQWQWQGYWMRY